jgi:hypothetical protein
MAEAVGVQRRAAEPAREEEVELLPRALEAAAVDAAQRLVARLEVHEVVETIDELADLRISADRVIGSGGIAFLGFHAPIFSPLIAGITVLASRSPLLPAFSP